MTRIHLADEPLAARDNKRYGLCAEGACCAHCMGYIAGFSLEPCEKRSSRIRRQRCWKTLGGYRKLRPVLRPLDTVFPLQPYLGQTFIWKLTVTRNQ